MTDTTVSQSPPEQAEYVIHKGGAYYRPNAQGYTTSLADAGRYTLTQAIRLSHPNGPDGPRDGISYSKAPEQVAQSDALRGLLREVRSMLSDMIRSGHAHIDQSAGDYASYYIGNLPARIDEALAATPPAPVEGVDALERVLSDFVNRQHQPFGDEPPEDNADWRDGFRAACDCLREDLRPWWPFARGLNLAALRATASPVLDRVGPHG